jgi:hypothetical protein
MMGAMKFKNHRRGSNGQQDQLPSSSCPGVVLDVALAEGFSSMRHHDERSQRFKIVASQDWPACLPFNGKDGWR